MDQARALVTEANLSHLENAIKHATLARITTDWDMVVNANVSPQPVDKGRLEWLDVTITEPFGDLIEGYTRRDRIMVCYLWQEGKHMLIDTRKEQTFNRGSCRSFFWFFLGSFFARFVTSNTELPWVAQPSSFLFKKNKNYTAELD